MFSSNSLMCFPNFLWLLLSAHIEIRPNITAAMVIATKVSKRVHNIAPNDDWL